MNIGRALISIITPNSNSLSRYNKLQRLDFKMIVQLSCVIMKREGLKRKALIISLEVAPFQFPNSCHSIGDSVDLEVFPSNLSLYGVVMVYDLWLPSSSWPADLRAP